MLTEVKREGVKVEQEVVGVFLTCNKKLFLFRRHSSKKFGGGLWALCAGGKENAETYKEGALRELREETGVTVLSEEAISEKIFYHYAESAPVSEWHVFHINMDETPQITLNEEHTEWRLVSYEEALCLSLMDGEREVIDAFKSVLV